MSTRSTRYKHVRVRNLRRKSFKKKRRKISRPIARTLISKNLLMEHARIVQGTQRKISKNKTSKAHRKKKFEEPTEGTKMIPISLSEHRLKNNHVIEVPVTTVVNRSYSTTRRSKKSSLVYPMNDQHHSSLQQK